MKQAVLYLIGRTFLLLLFLGLIMVSPLIAMFLPALYFLAMAIWSLFTKEKDTGGLFLISIILFIFSITQMQKVMEKHAVIFMITSMCIVLVAAAYQTRKFIYIERERYYMHRTFDKVTYLYPTFLGISGGLRMAIDIAVYLFGDTLLFLEQLVNPIHILGFILFVASIAMYIVRTIHIFLWNK